ncbi:MAG: aldo/keto reductase [Bacteroidetes bacterium]|nr:aldo/keto reductase [Bacteroidota bacterium]
MTEKTESLQSTQGETTQRPIPSLGFGTFQLKGATCIQAVATALEVGYRHIDTAQMYENEAEVGKAIRASGVPRSELFVTTKVWRTNLRSEDFRRSTDECLSKLGLDQVDLLLIHWPNRDIPLDEPLEALQNAKEEGKTKRVGVSNFAPSQLEHALKVIPDLACLQVEYHPLLSQDRLLEIVRSNGMFLTAYSPLGQGRLLDKWRLKRIARAHGKNTAQTILRWHLQQNGVVPIPRSGNVDHIRSNFDVFDFELTKDEMDRIDALDAGKRFVNPGWVDWER